LRNVLPREAKWMCTTQGSMLASAVRSVCTARANTAARVSIEP
jgi:hypothetical protein